MQQSVSTSLLAPWVARVAQGVRCLWVINRSTGTITWKRRDDYSCFREKSHLTSVFEQMAADLSRSAFADPNDLSLLCKLRSRVQKKYQRYHTAHCWLYRWLFASQLESTYRALINRINTSLYTCLSSCHQVPELRRVSDRERLFSLLIERHPAGQQNESLFVFLNRYPQFLHRVAVETIQANLPRIPIENLPQLTQVQVAAILPHINASLPYEGIEPSSSQSGNISEQRANLSIAEAPENVAATPLAGHRNSPGAQRLLAIGIGRLHEFGLLSQVNLDMFQPNELMQFIGDRQDLIPVLLGSSVVSSLNESLFTFADRFPYYLSRIAPEAIQANLSRIPMAHLSNLSQVQVVAILPHINAPVFNEEQEASSVDTASSAEQNANPLSGDTSSSSETAPALLSALSISRNSPGAQRLMAIGIGKLSEFGLLGQVHLGMFHPDEWMPFIGDRQDLVPALIESTIASSQNESLFSFTERHPQFLSNVPVPFVQEHLARIPIQNLSNLSREQIVAILPVINEPILELGGISSSYMFNSANWEIGPRRLIGIGIERLYEFDLLGQINLGLFDDDNLTQFISNRGDLLPHLEFFGLEASLHRIQIPIIQTFDDTLLQRFSLSSLSVEAIIRIGLQRFVPAQLEQHYRCSPDLLMMDSQRILRLDVTSLRPSLIAVLFDALSNSQTSQINLHLLTREEVAIILDRKYTRIKRLNEWGVAQNLGKLPDGVMANQYEWYNNFTQAQMQSICLFQMNRASDPTVSTESSSSTDPHASCSGSPSTLTQF